MQKIDFDLTLMNAHVLLKHYLNLTDDYFAPVMTYNFVHDGFAVASQQVAVTPRV